MQVNCSGTFLNKIAIQKIVKVRQKKFSWKKHQLLIIWTSGFYEEENYSTKTKNAQSSLKMLNINFDLSLRNLMQSKTIILLRLLSWNFPEEKSVFK